MFDPTVQAVVDQVNALRDQVSDHWQIPADEAQVLAQTVRVGRCVSLCEIGTSYGFSTLHLAAATRPFGGGVHTIDNEERKTEAARGHLREAGLEDAVTLHTGRGQDVLGELRPERPFDFVFIDAVKSQCFEYLKAVWPHLAERTVLATDNTVTHWKELEDFVRHLRSLEGFTSCNVPVGNGFELTVRS
jgi:predicted O-methyltransferase YrrM